MVRSKWTTVSIIASLACAGLAFAGLGRGEQTSSKAPAGVNPAEIITINEPGKPAQQCVIQKSTRQSDGKIAHEIRNLATGEVTTIYMEDRGQAKGQTATTPWASSKSASQPTASGIAPGGWSPTSNTKVISAPAVEPTKPAAPSSSVNKATAQIPATSGVSAGYRTIDEPGKPPLQCRIVLQWQTPEGHRASQLQAVNTGEYLTIVEANGLAASGGSTNGNDKVSAKLYRWGASKTPPPGVPVPSAAIASQPPLPFALEGQSVTKVVPPTSKSISTTQAQKPSASSSYANATTRSSPATPATTTWTKAGDSTRVINTAPVIETVKPAFTPPVAVKASDAKKATDPSLEKSNDVASGLIAMPKPLEIPTPSDPMKAADQPIAVEATSPNPGTKQLEMPKLPEIPRAPEPGTLMSPAKVDGGSKTTGLPQLPEPAKAIVPPPPLMPAIPPAISAEQKKSETAPDLKLLGVGKPSSDSTLPTDGKPSLTSAQPALSVPPVGSSVNALPPTLTQLTIGNAGMPSAAARKNDPLNSPEMLLPGRTEKDPVKSPSIGMAQATDSGRIPLGAGSVSAAGDPRYLPVPMVTIPKANPPMPPMLPATLPAATPGAPAFDQTPFVNAFTTAAPTNGQQQYPMQQPMMPQGYGMQGYPAMTPPGYAAMPVMPNQVQTSYRGPMPPNPVAGMQGYPVPMMPQGYAMPMAPQGYPMMPPQGYQMPMMPQGYPTQMAPMPPGMGYSNPAMDRPGVPVGSNPTMQQSINQLQSSIFPTKREQAIMQLCTCDPRANPGVVQLLLTTAKEDPSATVRAACVSGLARMGVASEVALATFTQLKSDADPRVRQEAEQALSRMTPANGVQPVGVVNRQ